MGDPAITVVLPAAEESAIVEGLRELTRLLLTKKPEAAGFGMAGPDGYGVDHDCAVFEMHPQWWGDCTDGCPWETAEDDTPHSSTCKAGRPNFLHKASGFEVRWYKWIGRSMELSREVSPAEWATILDECRKAVGS